MVGWLPIPIVDMQVAGSTRSRVAELDRKKKPASKGFGSKRPASERDAGTADRRGRCSRRGLRQADAALSLIEASALGCVRTAESWAAQEMEMGSTS